MKKIIITLIAGLQAFSTCNSLNSIIGQEEIIDLELISRSNGEPGGVIKAIDRTKTTAGQKALKIILSNPTAETQTLLARQQILKALGEQKLREKIERILNNTRKHEKNLEHSLDPSSRIQLMEILKKNYYQWGQLQGFNESAIALDLAHFFEFCSLFGPLIEHLILHFALDKINDITTPTKQSKKCSHHHHKHGHHHKHSHACVDCLLETDDSTPMWKETLFTTIKAGHFIFHLFNIKEMFDHLLYKSKVINLIHQQLISAHAVIKSAAELGELLKDLPVRQAALDIEKLVTLCDDAEELVASSLDPVFADDVENTVSMFSRVGPTLATYKKLEHCLALIQELLAAIGKVDAFLSTRKLIDEQASNYCFPSYSSSNQTYLEFNEFIHPQLGIHESGVKNSLTMDQNGINKILITGPNKAGKSTVAKAIAVNLILSQTLGIAAAKNACLTPVHRIVTYINIADNLEEDTSMFLAELMRADKAWKSLSFYEGKAPVFALFDDSLFRSTQPAKAEVAAYKFIKKLSELHSCAMVVVTHFSILTNLEQETKGRIYNYQIALINGENNSAASTYQLVPGVSTKEDIFSLILQEELQTDLLSAYF